MKEVTTPPTPFPTLYKILKDGASCHGGGHTWSLPTATEPGEWQEVEGDLGQCINGLHLTSCPQYRWRGGNELYEVEVDVGAGLLMPRISKNTGANSDRFVGYESDEWVARRVRLVRRVEGAELVALVRSIRPIETPAQLYAVLEDGCDPRDKAEWPLPKGQQPGEWVVYEGEMIDSIDGLRVTNDPDRFYRKAFEVWAVEVEGVVWETGSPGELRVSKARLVRRLSDKELDKLGVGVDRSYRRRSTWNNDRYQTVRKRDPKGMAPGEQFVRLMAEFGGVAVSSDSEHENRSVLDALGLAIRGGLEFKSPQFFSAISAKPANYYQSAIINGNESACFVIEEALARRPWMWNGGRLYEMSHFQWCGHEVRLTSFDDEHDQIVACAYQKKVRGSDDSPRVAEVVAKRFTIEHSEFDRVAKAWKVANGRGNSLTRKAEWLCMNVYKIKGTLAISSLTIAMWFWTKEQHAEVDAWIRTWKDAKAHKKQRVVPGPAPDFLDQAIKEVAIDCEAHNKAHKSATMLVGERPNYEDFKYEFSWRAATEAWEARFQNELSRLLVARNTPISRLERALTMWKSSNFTGAPKDYIGLANESKARRRN